MSKPSDLVDRLDLVKRQHAGAQVVPLSPPESFERGLPGNPQCVSIFHRQGY